MKVLSLLAISLGFAAEGETACDASATWRRMLAAREVTTRLENIRSVYIQEAGSYWSGFQKRKVRHYSLYVFPHLQWSWFDQDNRLFGIEVSVTDYSRRKTTVDKSDRVGGPATRDLFEGMTHPLDIPVLLLEVSGIKLRPKQCIHRDEELIVEAEFEDQEYTYHLRAGSELPYRVDRRWKQSDVPTVHRLSDYRNFGGLLAPAVHEQRTGQLPAAKRSVKYEMNPEYDPTVFAKPPSFASGPEAWRLRR